MLAHLILHRRKLLLIALLAVASLLASLWLGDLKPLAEVDWLDVVGEGGTGIALAVWMLLILGSRPAGRVTDWLTLGLGFLFLALWQDTLDEFIRLPGEQWWDQWLESITMPIGMVLLTTGLYFWHQEQLILNRHLRKREQLFREHHLSDDLMYLGQADYLRQQLQNYLASAQPVALVLVELSDAVHWLRRYGIAESERLLRESAEVMLITLRNQDLICRYAGSRFAIVLPDTPQAQACTLAWELQQALEHCAFRNGAGERVFQQVNWFAVASDRHDSAQSLLQRASDGLDARQQTQAVA